MMRLMLVLSLVFATASCGVVRNTAGAIGGIAGSGGAKRGEIVSDGVRYKARLRTDSADKREMTITVTPAGPSRAAALESGRYQATKYCIKTYGGSQTEWTVGPDTPVDQLPVTDNTITLTGRCAKR